MPQPPEGRRAGGVWPRVSARSQLIGAAAMWTMVGTGLSGVGSLWLAEAFGWWAPLWAVPILVLGLLKAHWVILRAAHRTDLRVRERGDGRPFGDFFSLSTWLLVVGMMALGQALRLLGVPISVRGPIYVAVGVALLVGSIRLWRRVRGAARVSTSG